jgi:hypothetical protein
MIMTGDAWAPQMTGGTQLPRTQNPHQKTHHWTTELVLYILGGLDFSEQEYGSLDNTGRTALLYSWRTTHKRNVVQRRTDLLFYILAVQ